MCQDLRPAAGQPDLETALRALLDRCPFGAVVTAADGRIVAANARAQELISEGRILRTPAALASPDIEDAVPLRGAIRAAAQAAVETALTLSRGARRLRAIVIPLETGWPSRGEVLAGVLLFDERPSAHPLPSQLEQLYGLTASEATLACGLLQGSSLRQAAGARRISLHTARHQLRGIFAKTGATRQSELMRLLLLGPASLRCTKSESRK